MLERKTTEEKEEETGEEETEDSEENEDFLTLLHDQLNNNGLIDELGQLEEGESIELTEDNITLIFRKEGNRLSVKQIEEDEEKGVVIDSPNI